MEKGTAGQDGRIRAAGSLLAVGVTLLLALGAAALASARGSTIHAGGSLAHLWLLFAFLSFAAALTAAYQLWVRRYGADQASEAAQRLNRAVLAVAAVLVIALPAAFYLARPATSGGNELGCDGCLITPATQRRPTLDLNTSAAKSDRPGKSLHLAPLLTGLGIAVGAAVIAAAVFLLVRLMRKAGAQPIHGVALPAREIVDDAELERAMLAGREALAGEARAAIIACYAAMEDSLSRAGVALLSSDSPADLLARAAAGGVIEGAAPGRLAELFREARYSTHEMGEDKLAAARAALDEILAQVTARQQAAAARAAAQAASRAQTAAAAHHRGRAGEK